MKQVKLTDAKGCLTLGQKFASRSFIVTSQDGSILLTPAVVIPEDELWLFQNHQSSKMVLDGLTAAR